MNQKPGFSDNLSVSSKNFAKNPVSRPRNGESETGFFPQSCAFIQKLRKKPGFSATNDESETGFFRQSFGFTHKLRKKPGFWATNGEHCRLLFSSY